MILKWVTPMISRKCRKNLIHILFTLYFWSIIQINFLFIDWRKKNWTEEQEDELRQLYMENQNNPTTDQG